HRFTCQFA
ncbi:hypothetical protein N499_1389B, partial [Wolbachia pipientis wVitA]